MITELEQRYIVVKNSHISALRGSTEYKELLGAISTIDSLKQRKILPELQALVIEHDWPEYEVAKQALLNRINGIERVPYAYSYEWHRFIGEPFDNHDDERNWVWTEVFDRNHPGEHERIRNVTPLYK